MKRRGRRLLPHNLAIKRCEKISRTSKVSVQLVLGINHSNTLTSKEISVYEVKTFLSHLQLSRVEKAFEPCLSTKLGTEDADIKKVRESFVLYSTMKVRWFKLT